MQPSRTPVGFVLTCMVCLATAGVAQEISPTRACHPTLLDTVGSTALVNVTLIDGTGAPPRAGTTVVYSGERIESIFPTGARQLDDDVRIVDQLRVRNDLVRK